MMSDRTPEQVFIGQLQNHVKVFTESLPYAEPTVGDTPTGLWTMIQTFNRHCAGDYAAYQIAKDGDGRAAGSGND